MKLAKSLTVASSTCFLIGLVTVLALPDLSTQQPPAPISGAAQAGASGLLQPMNWTAAEDHQNMMDQLGIKALRPGPSGNESAPNHANYDESKANPYPDLPDVLTLKNGKKVATAEIWWKLRRPEIVEDFEREAFGRVPGNAPNVT